MLVMADPPRGGGVAESCGHKPWPADWSAIIPDGVRTPPVTSFTASKAFSKSVDATSTLDAALAGDASLKGGIILTAAIVDKVLKGSMAREEMSKALEEK
jgi:hypothetical protein